MTGELDVSDLAGELGDRLVAVGSPLLACLADPGSAACHDALASLRNPYAIEDDPGAFQTTGWLGAFDSRPSGYAVAAETAADIADAVTLARRRGMRVVIKGTGHDYLGRSSDADALLIWTHKMRQISVHDSFTPQGSAAGRPGVPAITVAAGTRWLEAYQALLPLARYVQGGGCTSVGAAGGFVQGGGFGSLSRRFGTAAGNVLEIEVVTAEGDVLVVNDEQHSDLFWALRGGGGGTFGVVTKVTMRTHAMPEFLGIAAGTVRAGGDEEFRRLLRELVGFLPSICNDRWGEQARMRGDNSIEFFSLGVDMSDADAQAAWRPLVDWIGHHADAYESDLAVLTMPFNSLWDASVLDALAPEMICHDERPGQPADRFWWATNQEEVSEFIHAYESRWLPMGVVQDSPDALTDALFAASRHWSVNLHINKALAGASPEAVARDRATAINPAVFEAAALVLIASAEQDVFPGVAGHEPDMDLAAAQAARVGKAMAVIRELTPGAGSYVNETNYFEPDWQDSFWGPNYARLLEIKRRYDPGNLFSVHHGVGSEGRAG
jgi:FAD/FMN-containing dehydrogenase